MILRAQAFALFVMMTLTTSLQGTSVLQCLCSGRVFIAGFGKKECAPPRKSEKPHCPNCARKQAPAQNPALCAASCWRMIDFSDGQPQQPSAVLEIPTQAPTEVLEFALQLVPPRGVALWEPVAHRPPDPPGPSRVILYGSLLL